MLTATHEHALLKTKGQITYKARKKVLLSIGTQVRYTYFVLRTQIQYTYFVLRTQIQYTYFILCNQIQYTYFTELT
jgi:hypothetical protein